MRILEYFYSVTLITLSILLSNEFTLALRDVRVRVPHAVRRGEKATLKCIYNIEDDTLYSVKWYKGRREFYRYTPKETPPMKVFHFAGVKIKRIASNESQVVLDAVTMAASGKYSCEVSADAPSFHTLISSADLEVIETPHNAPFITGIRPRYRVGDILRGNCTSRHSKPAANLTWTVNNEEVNPAHVRHHKLIRDVRNEMETAIVGIHFVVTDQHFENGKLKLRCSAQIHDVYWKTTEKTILEADQYTKYGSSVNMVNPDELYDQYSFQEGEMLHNKKNSYLTQLQGEGDGERDEDAGAAWLGAKSGAASIRQRNQQQLTRPLALMSLLLLMPMLLIWVYEQLVQDELQKEQHQQHQRHQQRRQTDEQNLMGAMPEVETCNKAKQEKPLSPSSSSSSLLLSSVDSRMKSRLSAANATSNYCNNTSSNIFCRYNSNISCNSYCLSRQLTLET